MILVTGANGQLATCLKETMKGAVFLTKENFDITSRSSIENGIKLLTPKYIINCAAYTQVDRCEDETEQAEQANTLAPKYLAMSCKSHNIKLIHISTDYVFDGKKNTPYSELDVTSPTSVYGQSKKDGEENIINNCLDYIIIRTSWLYSEFGVNFVSNIIKLMNTRKELGIVYDQIGSPTYAPDLASAIQQITQHHFVPGIYHYANQGVTSWFDFTKEIQSIIGVHCDISPIESHEYPTKAIRPKYSVFNTNKIQETFNIKIPYWKESLQLCLKNLS